MIWLHRAVRLTPRFPFFPLKVGLFRKSGVKSRIQALRQMNENSPDNVNYEDQSAYDVADMVKQFFRDLPEPLLTSKLGETFLHIYQCKDADVVLSGFVNAAKPKPNNAVVPLAQTCRRTKGCRPCRRPSCWCRTKIARPCRRCSASSATSRPLWRRTRWHQWTSPFAWRPLFSTSTSSRKTISHQSNSISVALRSQLPAVQS